MQSKTATCVKNGVKFSVWTRNVGRARSKLRVERLRRTVAVRLDQRLIVASIARDGWYENKLESIMDMAPTKSLGLMHYLVGWRVAVANQ